MKTSILLAVLLVGCAKPEPVTVAVATVEPVPAPEFTVVREARVKNGDYTRIDMQEVATRDGSRCITATYGETIAMQCDFARGGK